MIYRLILVVFFLATLIAWAQPEPSAAELEQARTAARDAQSRAELEEKARDRKQATLKPDALTKTEETLNLVKDKRILERFSDGIKGFRFLFGGLATNSGFAGGMEYHKDLGNTAWAFRSSARVSTRLWQLYDLELATPERSARRRFGGVKVQHRNFASVNYYGPGPDSEKIGRSTFRLEDTTYEARGGLQPFKNFRVAGDFGFHQVNVGPGTDRRYASSERLYNPPGMQRQSDFTRIAFDASYDWRDIPGTPREGGLYRIRHSWFHDQDIGLYSFRRFDAEAQHYFGFFNNRRVLALRAKSSLAWAKAGQNVPFFFQPTVGGSDDLRGYRAFRFYDDNSFLMTAEYRWEVFTGLDMAIFADAGKVFPHRTQLNFKDLESAAGFGFRFNARNEVFLRVDVGFSHEGFQVWFKFNNAF
jgi:hypothetical protein